MLRYLILILLLAASTAAAKEKKQPAKPLKHPSATAPATANTPSSPLLPKDPFGGDEPSALDRDPPAVAQTTTANPPEPPAKATTQESKDKKSGKNKTEKVTTIKNKGAPTPATVGDKTAPKPSAAPDPFSE